MPSSWPSLVTRDMTSTQICTEQHLRQLVQPCRQMLLQRSRCAMHMVVP